ncbi:acyl carrier protein [Streptomyces sp. DSM 44915]|uniref:Acyl carrier protein n=1 Tax=Streptomyces chisholmiae TaxID=3075540 RepID=A0ABU2JTN6_9ACTN|nr:acyl carrier protein [Streptomyces sp. DSM 44915]MDT0268351.1 acyl carrier protein [Streptomyces sp. DSM 44915]UZD11013.1 acyl carrier protein [Marinispora sp. CNQ-140]
MTQEEIFTILTSVFAEIIPDVDTSGITLEDSLRDLGANSIDRADIITDTMEQAGVSLPMVSFADAKSIGDIVRIIAAGSAS